MNALDTFVVLGCSSFDNGNGLLNIYRRSNFELIYQVRGSPEKRFLSSWNVVLFSSSNQEAFYFVRETTSSNTYSLDVIHLLSIGSGNSYLEAVENSLSPADMGSYVDVNTHTSEIAYSTTHGIKYTKLCSLGWYLTNGVQDGSTCMPSGTSQSTTTNMARSGETCTALSTASFSVNLIQNLYDCFGCGTGEYGNTCGNGCQTYLEGSTPPALSVWDQPSSGVCTFDCLSGSFKSESQCNQYTVSSTGTCTQISSCGECIAKGCDWCVSSEQCYDLNTEHG